MKNKDKYVSLFVMNLKYEIISVIYKLYFLNKYYVTLYEIAHCALSEKTDLQFWDWNERKEVVIYGETDLESVAWIVFEFNQKKLYVDSITHNYYMHTSLHFESITSFSTWTANMEILRREDGEIL